MRANHPTVDKPITIITLNQNSNLNGIGAAQIDHNQMTLDEQTERTHLTDRVPKLKSRRFLKFSTYNVRTLLRPGTIIINLFNVDKKFLHSSGQS